MQPLPLLLALALPPSILLGATLGSRPVRSRADFERLAWFRQLKVAAGELLGEQEAPGGATYQSIRYAIPCAEGIQASVDLLLVRRSEAEGFAPVSARLNASGPEQAARLRICRLFLGSLRGLPVSVADLLATIRAAEAQGLMYFREYPARAGEVLNVQARPGLTTLRVTF